jgi:hypothetical protein
VLIVVLLTTTASTVFADGRPECNRDDSNSICQGNITVFVYLDTLPDSIPLTGARVTFVTPTGDSIQRVSARTGLLNFASVDILPEEEALFRVEYPAQVYGAGVVPCSNSPTVKRIDANSFGPMRSAHINFCGRPYRIKD